jgi:TrpR-related protein YerC/YecD
MSKVNQKDIEELYSVILKLESLPECKKFFRDLLTEKEIDDITERWKIAKMLIRGVPYSQIESELGISSTTIARVHKWVKRGKGGYLIMMKRMGIIE